MKPPRDPLAFDFGLDFRSSADRVRDERPERIEWIARQLPFYHAFLDDYLRAIMPHDLILIGARTGAGKTELARTIAATNALAGKTVHYFALEAEPNEIERRTKFQILGELVFRDRIEVPGGFSYPDWYTGRVERHVQHLDGEATEIVAHSYASLHTYYRGSKFGHDDIRRLFLAVQDATDLIVLDHLHYVDIEDDNENRGFKQAVKMIRDIAIAIGRPVILVVHLRKTDVNSKHLVPEIDEVHGSSDTGKIATSSIMLAPAKKASLKEAGYTYRHGLVPTYFGIPKYRVGGSCPYVALVDFDWRRRTYSEHYTLGFVHGTQFQPLGTDDVPSWAYRHQPLAAAPPHAGAEA